MRLFVFILTAVAAINCSVPAYTAMDALSNESMSSVKGDPGPGMNGMNQSPATTEEPETSSGKNTEFQNQNISESSLLDSKLKALNECSDYKKFLFYLKKLEQFANKDNYNQVASSDKFMFFCSCLAATAKKCSDKLSLSLDSNSNNTTAPILQAKNRIFYKADRFYNHLLHYRNGKAPHPDVKKLISELKQNQNDFEVMYTNLKNKDK